MNHSGNPYLTIEPNEATLRSPFLGRVQKVAIKIIDAKIEPMKSEAAAQNLNPFIKIKFKNERQKTRIIQKSGLHPEWYEFKHIHIKQEDMAKYRIFFSLLSKNYHTGKDLLIGTVALRGNVLNEIPERQLTVPLQIGEHKKADLTFLWTLEDTNQFYKRSFMTKNLQPGRQLRPHRHEPGRLMLSPLSAKISRAGQFLEQEREDLSPWLKIVIGSGTGYTEPCTSGDTSPSWTDQLVFFLDDTQVQEVVVEMYDSKKKQADDFIAKGVYNLNQFTNVRAGTKMLPLYHYGQKVGELIMQWEYDNQSEIVFKENHRATVRMGDTTFGSSYRGGDDVSYYEGYEQVAGSRVTPMVTNGMSYWDTSGIESDAGSFDYDGSINDEASFYARR